MIVTLLLTHCNQEGGINETPQRGMGRAFPVHTQHTPMPSLHRSRFDEPLSMYLPDGSAYPSDRYIEDNFDETLSRTFPGSELMTEVSLSRQCLMIQ